MGSFKIKEMRERAGITQQELADEIDVKTRTLGSWERGEREPDLMTAWALADTLKCSLDELAGRTEYYLVSFDENGRDEPAGDVDHHFERIRNAYEKMNRDSQMMLAEFAESFACDPRRRK